jgi:hypothetical protein
MPTAFVLKLVGGALSQRRIVGRIETVETGEQAVVRNAGELIDFLYEHANHHGEAEHDQPGEPHDQAR